MVAEDDVGQVGGGAAVGRDLVVAGAAEHDVLAAAGGDLVVTADLGVHGDGQADELVDAVGPVAGAAEAGHRDGEPAQGVELGLAERPGAVAERDERRGLAGSNQRTTPRSPKTMSPPVPPSMVSAPCPPKTTSGRVEVSACTVSSSLVASCGPVKVYDAGAAVATVQLPAVPATKERAATRTVTTWPADGVNSSPTVLEA